ncbi:MAG: LLM class F420-dependent oxidoreductase, partial [Chloroflexota bacterium]
WVGFGIEARVDGAVGGPDDWRKAADEWQILGATHLSITTTKAGFEGPDAHIARIRSVWEALR